MQIHLEANESHTIEAYTDSAIQICSVTYDSSVIVSAKEIITDLTINTIKEVDLDLINVLARMKPKVIIIGHQQAGQWLNPEMASTLSKQGIGVECMSIGAACRTFNVLLSEGREVVAAFIFSA